MNKIKFTHNYPKLWNQNKAKLIYVEVIPKGTIQNNKDLIEYDTKTDKGEYYTLPDAPLIQLIFLGNNSIPFCTLRRYTDEKYNYYKREIENDFEIQIGEDIGK